MADNSNLRDRAGQDVGQATSRERVKTDIDSGEVRSRLTEDEQQSVREEDTKGGAPSRQTNGARDSSGQIE